MQGPGMAGAEGVGAGHDRFYKVINLYLLMTLGKLSSLSEPQLTHVQSGDSSPCLAFLYNSVRRGCVCLCVHVMD